MNHTFLTHQESDAKNKYIMFSFPELQPSSFDRSRHGEDDGDNEKSPDPHQKDGFRPVCKKRKYEQTKKRANQN